jgi:hypothetical protein
VAGSTAAGTVILLGLHQLGVRGDQRTVGVTQLVGDLPQLRGHPTYPVLDFGNETAGPAQRLPQLRL